MKTLSILCLALICATTLIGQSSEKREGPPPRSEHAETRMLHHFLEMKPAELAKLREAIERIERMTPEEKAQLREKIGKLEKMKPERVEAMRKRFEAIPKEERDAMRKKWLEMTPEERKEWRTKLREMSHEERTEVFKEQGFLPGGKPPKGPKPQRSSGENEE